MEYTGQEDFRKSFVFMTLGTLCRHFVSIGNSTLIISTVPKIYITYFLIPSKYSQHSEDRNKMFQIWRVRNNE